MSNDNLFAAPSEEELNDPLFAPPSEEELNPISKMDSFKAGAVQGATLGFGDELAGAMNVGFDKSQALLNKLGLASPSPSQVDEQLLQQGATGDLNPDMYTQARDQVRAENKAAEEANLKSYIGGNIAGGLAPTLLAGTAAAPFKVAEGATRMAKIGTAMANAAPVSAVTALGMTNEETLPEQAKDVAIGTAIGSGGAGLLTGAGQLMGKVGEIAGDKLPGLKHVYDRGIQGVKTYGDEFTQSTNKQLNQYVDTLGSFLKSKRDIINQGRQKALQGVDDQIASVDASLQDEMKMLQSGLNLSKESERQSLMKQINAQSIKTQKNLQSIKKNVGKVYDNLEKEIQDKNISFNVNDEIANFGEDLQMAGLQPDEAMQFQKKFLENFEKGDLSLNELRSVKNKLVGLFNSGKPEVRKAAKMAYGRINDKQVNILETAGDVDLANSMKDANQRYKSILQLEEDYIGQITPNRVTGTIEPSNEMQKTIQSFGTSKPSPKDFRTQEEFQKLTQVADPEFAQQSTAELNKLASQLKANEALDVAGPSIKDMQSTSNRYQELLKQKEALAQRPEKTQFDKLMNTKPDDEKVLDDYVRRNLKNTVDDIDQVGKVDIKNILGEYKKATGKDITPEVETLVKDASTIQEASEGLKGVGVQSIGGFKSFGQDPVNMLGRAVGKLQRFNDPNAKVYESQIAEALRKGTKPALDALYFSLMQQPQFRKMMQEDKGNESKP